MNKNLKGSFKETRSTFLSLQLPDSRLMGKVHSIFKTSFNIEMDSKLIHFGSSDLFLSSFGINLSRKEMTRLLDSIQVGDLVKYQDDLFTFYSRKIILKTDIQNHQLVHLTLDNDILLKDIQLISEIYNSELPEKLYDQIGLMDKVLFEKLSNPKMKSNDLLVVFKQLVGKGLGLTPSGDDILLGFIATYTFFKDDSMLDLFKKISLEKTTDISKAYFYALTHKYVSSQFLNLFYYLKDTDTQGVKQSIELIKKYGHTSGLDTLFGIHLALTRLVENKY